MLDFIKKLLSLAISKGLLLFVVFVGIAQQVKWDLAEIKHGDYASIVVWSLLAAPIIIYEIVKAKRNK